MHEYAWDVRHGIRTLKLEKGGQVVGKHIKSITKLCMSEAWCESSKAQRGRKCMGGGRGMDKCRETKGIPRVYRWPVRSSVSAEGLWEGAQRVID